MTTNRYDSTRQWYAIHTYSGYEEKVAESIQQRVESVDMADKIFAVLVPKEKQIEIKNGKRKIVEKKIFQGYVLVEMKMTEDAWYIIRNTPGVTGFVGSGTEPTPVSDAEIAKIKKRMGVEDPKHQINYSIGEVVNIMTYGAFVKLEPGIEGLVHISEMSWTKRINHPNELVQIGDKIEVQVLNINKDKQEISLGMKQCQSNPWEKVAEKYPPNTVVKGIVRNLTNYGAFIEIEEGIDGLLHVSDMSWVRKVTHPNEVLQKGQEVTCVVLSVDQERKRIALGLKQLASDPWETDIPARYHPNQVVNGKVTKITNFGVFVELETGLEGLLHISELADHKVENPEEVVKVGDSIEVKVLRVDPAERKIGLSRKRAGQEAEEGAEAVVEEVAADTGAPKRELKGGMGSGSGPLFSMPEAAKDEPSDSPPQS